MTGTVTRHRSVLVVAALALLAVGLFPLLRANAVARQQAWAQSCVRTGGAVSTEPAAQPNPLITQTGHTIYQCRSADGRLVSERD